MLGRQMLELSPIRQLREEMSRLMEDFLGEAPLLEWEPLGRRTLPAMNLWEDENNLFIEAEIPGFRQDQLEITIAGGELKIEGERPELDWEKKATAYRRERPQHRFSRAIRLPYEVKQDEIEAAIHDGVLTITLPKSEALRPRKIKVKALPA